MWLISFCRARNAIGSVTQNYSLEVSGLNPLLAPSNSHGPLAVVTGISPVNSSLVLGQSGKLTCSVRSPEMPHIKWLKQVNLVDIRQDSEANILNVRDNRYQILPTAKDIKVGQDEYINVLNLDFVTEQDNGTYICFVAKNGLNSLTFKSADVFILTDLHNSQVESAFGHTIKVIKDEIEDGHISLAMMLVIICLSVASVSMLIVLAIWYMRYMRGPKTNSSSATGTSESSIPESPDEHHFTHLKAYEQRPNFVYGGHHQLWGGQSHHVYPSQQQYPLLQHHQLWPQHQQPQKVNKITACLSSR